ncbi:Dimethylhistidine N-methyltransferase [Euzebya pacifica]|uniref:Dimethylhistidine N-methyltransferase n=2 Tax=Euzebya pacifica TaxID=1608957 RepID=A0A346Y268_9ACTN|nr:L-histidine N(alpha)-methyltransferase [Euzebya pacifica]AXV08565.1 Dimethylhistidine N-methyltransferase [Euzebya pacifica]
MSATFDLTRIAVDTDYHGQMAADVRAGLTATPKALPPKYFYDAAGSELFVRITQLEEYYQTRTETAILEQVADAIVADIAPVELVELGSGASRKTRVLLEAMHRSGAAERPRYVPFDVSEDAIVGAAEALTGDYAWLDVHGIVGDFDHHLTDVPRSGRRLVAFLGSTIGNLDPDEQVALLTQVRAMLDDGDGFVLGVDLVKDATTLVRAYDDAEGVTAAFNRNVLHNVNATLGADFEPDDFDHVARWNDAESRIEMWLRARRDMQVRVKDLDLDVELVEGEEVHTEISSKFTEPTITDRLATAGLRVARFDTDPRGWFGVVTAVPAG